MILVDDHFLAAGIASGALGARASGTSSGGVATTCSWWWRLSSALAGSRSGSLSAYFSDLDERVRSELLGTIAHLSSRVVVLDLRELISAMAVLSAEHDLNLLSAEAVVAAELLGAELVVGRDTPKVRATAAQRGIPYRVEAVSR